MGSEIRAGTRDDAGAIARVHIAAWREGYAGVVPDSLLYADDFEADRLRMWTDWRFNPGQRVSVCVRRDGDGREEITGFAAYGPEHERTGGFAGRGELYALYVLPECWGVGPAATLIEHTDERLRAEGFHEAVLWVLKQNPRARAFYEKHGWTATGRGDVFDAGDGVQLPQIEYHKELT